MDVQQIEILGRQRLIEELIRAGVEVAMPIRDHGTDLVAYIDRACDSPDSAATPFVAAPIQLKAATRARFSIHKKYNNISGLLLVYIWNVRHGVASEFYALTYGEALKVAEELGWTKTNSWRKDRGKYTCTKPSVELISRLEVFKMNPKDWKAKIRVVAGA